MLSFANILNALFKAYTITTRPIIDIKDDKTMEIITAASKACLLLKLTTDSITLPYASLTVLSSVSSLFGAEGRYPILVAAVSN